MEKPALYILCGIPFSGKTTLARELVKRLGFVRVDLDEVKFSLLGRDIKDEQIDQVQWDKVYQEMYKRIESHLKKGKIVVNDTGNFTRHERNLVRKTADRFGLKSIVIYVDTPKSVAQKRLLENRKTGGRFDVSDEDFENTVKEMEFPMEDEDFIVFDGSFLIEDWLDRCFAS